LSPPHHPFVLQGPPRRSSRRRLPRGALTLAQAVAAPSMTSVDPDTVAASSEARYATAAATSSGVTMRPIGDAARAKRPASAPSGISKLRRNGVSTDDGHTEFTRTPALASSIA